MFASTAHYTRVCMFSASLAALHSCVLLFIITRVRASVNIQHVAISDKMFQIE